MDPFTQEELNAYSLASQVAEGRERVNYAGESHPALPTPSSHLLPPLAP